MNPDLLSEAQRLWTQREATWKFNSRYQVLPPKVTSQVVRGFEKLSQDIPSIQHPESLDDLHAAELQRRLSREVTYLDHLLVGTSYTREHVASILGLQDEEVNGLGQWLDDHRTTTIEAVERKFESTVVEGYELDIDLDDPDQEREAEGVARSEIGKFHVHVGKLIAKKTKVGTYLRDIRAVPLKRERSEFKWLTKKLLIGIPAICFIGEDDVVRVNHHRLLSLYGHEGMGHGLHKVVTDARSDLPFFLKENSVTTIAAEESITQHFERVVFHDVNDDNVTQHALGIEHLWSHIFQDEQDTQLITDYNRALYAYAIMVLSDASFGDPQDRATIRKKVDCVATKAINPYHVAAFMDSQSRTGIDSHGNLNFDLAFELRYSAKPVRDTLNTFGQQGMPYHGDSRSTIDLTLLTGYWTPEGLRQHADLVARGVISVE